MLLLDFCSTFINVNDFLCFFMVYWGKNKSVYEELLLFIILYFDYETNEELFVK